MLCVKTMRDMTARWIQKNNAMHVNPKHKRCKKNRLIKYLKTENFSVSISRASIEYQSSQAEARLEKSGIFRLIKNHNQSIENLAKPKFLKIEQFYVETPQSIVFYE